MRACCIIFWSIVVPILTFCSEIWYIHNGDSENIRMVQRFPYRTPVQSSFYGLGHSNLITCLTSFFWKKNPVRLQKKKRKKSNSVSYGRKWFENFLSDSKKKKKKVLDLRIFIVRVTQSTSGVNNAVVEPHI